MKNQPISVRLGIAFSLLITLLITVSWVGLHQMASINSDLKEIVNKRWAKVQLAREALYYSKLNNRITMEIFFLRDKAEIDPLLTRRVENSEKISSLVKKIEQQLESGKEKELLDAVRANRTPYIDSYLHGIELLVNQNKYDEAQRNMIRETLPRLLAYHSAWNDFVQFQGGRMDEAASASRAGYASTRKLTLALIISSVLVAILIAGFVTRNLTVETAHREAAEEALRDAETRYRILVEKLPAVPYVAEPGEAGEWRYVSPKLELLLGFSAEEWMADRHLWFQQIQPEDREAVVAEEKASEARGEAFHLEYRMFARDGRVVWIHDAAALVPDAPGERLLQHGVLFDISERKRAEQELASKVEELARSNAELEQFAYVASHDLQEPLRMVASYTQLLARRYKGKLDTDADEFIGFAVDGATRMQTLIQDLLCYSRVTTKGQSLQLTQTKAACDTALQNLQTSIKESNAVVNVGPMPSVLADEAQVAQLFQNLIGNALKYRNECRPEIQVTARANGKEWVFSVQDNGIGIEPQYFERIFQMFQRLHTREQFTGTGIGLAVCRKIVERHGGRIWVESQPGKGSTFLFTIPRAEERTAK